MSSHANKNIGRIARLLAIAAVLLAGYGVNALRIRYPLLRLDLFRLRTFRAAVGGSFFSRLGLGGIPFPAEYGGGGADYATYALVLEELAVAGGADGPEFDAGVPQCVGPGPHDPLDHVRPRIGGEVEVRARPPQQRIAHTAADQVELMSRRSEQLPQRRQQFALAVQRDQRPRQQRGVERGITAGTGLGHVLGD